MMNYNIPLHPKFSAWRAALHLALVVLLVGAVPSRLAAQSGGDYVITQAVLGSGGGSSASVNYQLTGTIGQSLADSGMSSGGVYDLASGFWNPQQNAPAGGLEADVASRPDGNGVLSATDITQMRRFVAALDNAGFGSEFQRADSAPRTSFGNGAISATDITQTRRYVAALDATATTNGPASPGGRPQPVAPQSDAPAAGRIIRIVSQLVTPGNQVVVPIELDSQGNEVAVSFSVNYDPAVLSVNNDPTRITLGDGVPAGTVLTRNATTPGRLGIVLDSGTPFTAGTRRMVNIAFTTLTNPTTTNLTFGDVPTVRDISDDQAQSLLATYQPGTVTITAPTLARIEKYDARHFAEGNLIQWQSSFEVSNLGFNVYRQEAAISNLQSQIPQANGLTLITPRLIAGSALFAGGAARLTAGNSYAWWDKDGPANSVYYVEDIDLNGTTTLHGPVTARAEGGGRRDATERSSPLLAELRPDGNGTGLREHQFAPKALREPARPAPGSDAWQQQLRLAAGAAVKISVHQTGWYRVGAAQLQAAGLPADARAAMLQLFVNGVQVPLRVRAAQGGMLGSSGVIEFYGIGNDTRDSDSHTYWLIAGDTAGLRYGPPARVAPAPEDAAAATPDAALNTSFAFTVERKDRTIYAPGILNGAAENFFGAVITAADSQQTLHINNLDANATTSATLALALQGATTGAHQVAVSLNGTQVGLLQFTGQEHPTARFNIAPAALRNGDNTVTLRSLNGSSDVSVTDYLRLTYAHRYAADNNALLFTGGNRASAAITGFTTPEVRVFDLTEPGRYFEVAARVQPDGPGFTVSVSGNLNRRQLLAVADDLALTPAAVSANEPSAWTNSARGADFLIVTPRDWRAAAMPLAAARQAQGLRTEIVNIEDIYDEWSGGAHDAAALAQFLAWTRHHWAAAPRYVLLLGDASLDPRNYLGYGNLDFVPTASVDTSELETASDEALTDENGDGLGELAVGRLPARNPAQAQLMIAKTLAYQPGPARGALLVADHNNGYDFAATNQLLRQQLPAAMPVTVLNRAGQDTEAMRQQIVTAFNAGPALAVYAGHGSVQVWTGAGILRTEDALNLTNGTRLPLVISLSCLNGYFHDLTSESLAEGLLRAEHGGAAAVWASSGLTTPQPQRALGLGLLQELYGPAPARRLGDAVRAAKAGTADAEVRRSWILLGDPTLPLH